MAADFESDEPGASGELGASGQLGGGGQPGGPGERDYEELLRRAQPEAPVAWRHETERALFGDGAPAKAGAGRRWFGGRATDGKRSGATGWQARRGVFAAAVGGLAAVVLGVSLAGGGPLASDGGDDARAKPGCTTVYVTEMQPAGELLRGADGKVRVETTQQPVTREVERCR